MLDLYRILEVSPEATQAQIKSAYRRLARDIHPDVSASPDASDRFAVVCDAYQILGNSRRRAEYDRLVEISMGQTGGLARVLEAATLQNLKLFIDSGTAMQFARLVEVASLQREFDAIVDEMLERERQESAALSDASRVVVPLFVSAFLVMLFKPTILEEMNLIGQVVISALAVCGLVYMVMKLAEVLKRYTYQPPPDGLTSLLRIEEPPDKSISRQAGLVFLVSGYLVSAGLGYVAGQVLLLRYASPVSVGTVIGVLIYPPIAVLIFGGLRRIGGYLNLSS